MAPAKAKPIFVKIAGLDYEVVLQKSLTSPDGERCHGYIDTASQRVYLDAGGTKERREIALMHEVIHGIEEACGISLTEEQVDALSRHLWLAGFRL